MKQEVIFNLIKDDHIIALKEDGLVYAMGDDTFGQCGQDDKNRNTHPPYVQTRIKYPVPVVIISFKNRKISKIS